MTDKRYADLMADENLELTKEEILEGWHFCWEFDGLLRNNNEEDFKCTCFATNQNLNTADSQ